MTTKKRAYKRKIKGCHECSQRRIDCDRTQPSCTKCVTKGIACSGLGIRYRFGKGVFCKGRSVSGAKTESNLPTAVGDSQSLNIATHSLRSETDDSLCSQGRGHRKIATPVEYYNNSSHQSSYDQSHQILISHSITKKDKNHRTSKKDRCRPIEESNQLALSPTPDPNTMTSWKQYLLAYFSIKIAPELMVVDDTSNGWRTLVLPIAHLDATVMNAVLSTSSFHFTTNIKDGIFNSQELYLKAIHQLQQRQHLGMNAKSESLSIILSLLVLLVASMVSGYSDSPIIFRLLDSVLATVGGIEALGMGEPEVFLRKQIPKLRGYAAPLLSQPDGVATLTLTASFDPSTSQGWQCFRTYYHLYPNLSDLLSRVYGLHKLACNIYVNRVAMGPSSPPQQDLLQQFYQILQTLPNDTKEEGLRWATFIAAAESDGYEQQQFFTNFLLRHHQRNGFGNIPIAVKHLQRIWSRSDGMDWTSLLPSLQLFIV